MKYNYHYLAAFFILCAANAKSQTYTVAGKYVETYFQENGTVASESRYSFNLYFADGKWRIKLKTPPMTNIVLDCAFDGSYVRTHLSSEPDANSFFIDINTGATIASPTNMVSLTSGSAYISKRKVPRPLGYRPVSLIWFGLAAHDYQNSIKNRIKPFFVTATFGREEDELYIYDVYQEVDVLRVGGVVAEMVIISDGTVWGWNQSDAYWTSEPEKMKFSSPYDKGFTNGLYRATDFRKLADFSLPQKIEYLQFTPRSFGVHNTDLFVRGQIAINIDQIDDSYENVDLNTFVPDLPTEVHITDRRFEFDQPPIFRFSYRSDRWLNDSEVRKLPEYAAQVRAQASVREHPTFAEGASSIGVFLIIFSVASLFGLALLVTKGKKG